MFALLAAVPLTITGWAQLIILVCAIVAIVCVAVNAMGVAIPGWVQKILWIVLIAVVAISAVQFIASWAW